MSIPLQSRPIDELFYYNYQYDALEYCIDILDGLIESYKKVLKDYKLAAKDREFNDKKLNILRYEIIAKLCHYAENLGAFAYAFMKSDKIEGVYNIICNYKVNWVNDLYNFFLNQNTDTPRNVERSKIVRIFAYPQPTTKSSRNQIDESILNIRKLLVEIGGVYVGGTELKFKESYNSYKHGYRILTSKEAKTNKDVIICLGQDGKASLIPVDTDSMKVVLILKKYCRILFETMLYNNRVRHNLIKNNITNSSKQISFVTKQGQTYKIVNELSKLTIKNISSYDKQRYIYLIN